MKRKNNTIKVIVIVTIIFVGILGFYFYQMNNFTGGISSAHFEVFPEGADIGPESVGVMSNSFDFESTVGIFGESDVSKEVSLTYKIFDSYGKQIISKWFGNKIRVREGSFAFCCLKVPQTSGEYTLKLYLNHRESKSLTFLVFG